MTSQLGEAEAVIWHAYEQGWERPIRQAYREACPVANIVADLVIDTAIATSCGRGRESHAQDFAARLLSGFVSSLRASSACSWDG